MNNRNNINFMGNNFIDKNMNVFWNNNINNMNNRMNNLKNNFNNNGKNNLNKCFSNENIFSNNPITKKPIGINPNNKITIRFAFMASNVFPVKCKLNEKLSEVIERFKNKCPQQLKEQLSIPIYKGLTINPEKTLSEIGIKNGEIILFIKTKKDGETKKKKIENKEKGHELTQEELKQVKKWLEEYMAMKFMKMIFKEENKNNVINDDNIIPLDSRGSVKFLDFILEKEKSGAIIVKEHEHKLVYCLTNFSWNCNLCNKNYEKKNARYFCSICDYNMCDECHSKRDYIKKKVFPESVTPSNTSVKKNFFKTNHHEHRLVYCRTSRSVIGYNGWICDICREDFENDVWSFFCTNCDFDLCCSCAGYN